MIHNLIYLSKINFRNRKQLFVVLRKGETVNILRIDIRIQIIVLVMIRIRILMEIRIHNNLEE